MTTKADNFSLKKQPVQGRSKFLVESIKQAATQVLREYGLAGFTTNVVAERAGVSIGSLYQYFATKETLVAQIKLEHFTQLRGLFQQTAQRQTDDLNEVINDFVDASIKGHLIDPQLHLVLSSDLADFPLIENDQSEGSILSMIEQVLKIHRGELRPNIDISAAAELCYHLVEKTIHNRIKSGTFEAHSEAIGAEIKQMLQQYLLCPSQSKNS